MSKRSIPFFLVSPFIYVSDVLIKIAEVDALPEYIAKYHEERKHMLRRMNEEIDKIKAEGEREKMALLAKFAPSPPVDSIKPPQAEMEAIQAQEASPVSVVSVAN